MRFPLYLAFQNLIRHPARNLLYILGISITAALLLDMILLSGGLSLSIEKVLRDMGYEIRISPKDTLPFETEAQILNFNNIRKQLLEIPEVSHVDAMLGTTVVVDKDGSTFTTFALGLNLRKPVLYAITAGTDVRQGKMEVLVNTYLAEAKHIRPGNLLKVSIPSRHQLTGVPGTVTVRVAGIAKFYLDGEGQFSISCDISLLQDLLQQRSEDPVSALLVKLNEPRAASRIAPEIDRKFPQLSSYTIGSVIEAVEKQLSYFKQFAYILGGISLVVTFVLVVIITTISFHDRLGEIALLRAIGLSRKTIAIAILFEGLLISLASSIFGFLLGKFVAIYLDAILTSAPGLPADFSFFVMEASAVGKAVLTLLLTGLFAGVYPAFAAMRMSIAETLREEIL